MKHRLRTIPMALVLIISLALPVSAASTTLGVAEIDQYKTNWCWAACSEMIGSYYNSSAGRDQYDIVQKVKGNTNNVTGSAEEIRKAIDYASGDSVSFTAEYEALPFASCQTEINNSDPFVACLMGRNMHAVVVAGYKTGSTNYLYVVDPNPANGAQYYSYTQMVNGTTGTLGTGEFCTTVYRY